MYLVRLSRYELIDLNTGIRWYNALIGLYANLPYATGNAVASTCIEGEAQERVWKHLESLVKYDTTKADPQSTHDEPSALDALCYCTEPDGLDDRSWAIGMGGR